MITQTQSYNFPGSSGASTVYYTMSSNSSSVSVTPASGSVTPGTTVEFTFTFANESSFSTQFTLSCYDDVCATPVSNVFSLANPCSTLAGVISNTPSITNPFIFTLAPSGGSGTYTKTWQYNTAIFNLVAKGTTGNKLELSLKSPKVNLPSSTEIKAVITDSNGCSETASYSYTFCTPVVSNQFKTAACIPSQSLGGLTVTTGVSVTLTATGCAGTTIDWDTLELSYDTTKLYVNVVGDTLTIYATAVTTATSYNITYSVLNSVGISSNEGTITVSVPVCSQAIAGPSIAVSSTKLPPGYSAGTTVTLDVESITFTTDD